MKLSDFKYTAGKNAIAQEPLEPRDSSKLLVVNRKTQEIENSKFTDISDYFSKGDCLVVNDSRVFPARLIGRKEKTGARIEVMILRKLKPNENDALWDAVVDPARKVRIGNKIYFDEGQLYCEIIDNTTSRGRTVRFNYQGDLFKLVERIGQMPLPPYIHREADDDDRDWYQSMFAKNNGSVAAPTACLHFTKKVIQKLERKGVKIVPITVHINRSTFEPIEVEDLTKHKMHSEPYEISTETAEIINKTIKQKGKVFAAGSSVARALESSVLASRTIKAQRNWTDKFIYPPYDFRVVDHMLTNFHPSESATLMMVCAFGGRDLVMKSYKTAVKDGYRLLSYGDAMLIL
ncbi:MAG: tRNA preQ1(34) S-adenosylmethionine ribosyltransferase-isomerase QueA [Chlorobiota bacterium]|nr:tRNA preQ1(34) S-adenosylmethionine ribosyltransferase-isomerase QueA [Chlorobiota bacterium]QQS66125.1 MAG: tRNA preQ1(34) S-adenosylmethionine ribosyltransferase-isomerase QueA [Chlorobiota bacterium]